MQADKTQNQRLSIINQQKQNCKENMEVIK